MKNTKEKEVKKETKTAKTEKAETKKVAKAEPKKTVKAEPKEEVDASEMEKARAQKYMVTYDKENKDWVIKKTGAVKASKRCKTKKEALEIVEKLAENQDLNVSVKKKDGKFQKKY